MELQNQDISCLQVIPAKEQISSDLGGEAVILNLKTGVYHGLDPVGARIWSLIQETPSIKSILDILLQEYDVELDRCHHDLFTLLDQLADAELIEVKNATTV